MLVSDLKTAVYRLNSLSVQQIQNNVTDGIFISAVNNALSDIYRALIPACEKVAIATKVATTDPTAFWAYEFKLPADCKFLQKGSVRDNSYLPGFTYRYVTSTEFFQNTGEYIYSTVNGNTVIFPLTIWQPSTWYTYFSSNFVQYTDSNNVVITTDYLPTVGTSGYDVLWNLQTNAQILLDSALVELGVNAYFQLSFDENQPPDVRNQKIQLFNNALAQEASVSGGAIISRKGRGAGFLPTNIPGRTAWVPGDY